MWATLMDSLHTALSTALPDSTVELGASAELPRESTVWLVRGVANLGGIRQGRMEQEVLIECWVYDEDAQAAYAALQALELATLEAIAAWVAAGVPGLKIKATYAEAEPDNDAFRPASASRIRLSLIAQRGRDACG